MCNMPYYQKVINFFSNKKLPKQQTFKAYLLLGMLNFKSHFIIVVPHGLEPWTP